MLKVEGLNVYYGAIHALHDVSFEVKKGETVTLIGANGAGKTTILHTVSGLVRAKSGTVSFLDKDITTADGLVKSFEIAMNYCKKEILGIVLCNASYEKGAVNGKPITKGRAWRAFVRIAHRLDGKNIRLPKLSHI